MDIAWILDNLFLCITIAIYALALYNVWRIVNSENNPPAALAWVLANLVIPFIGVPLYFLLGENRLRQYVKKRKRSNRELATFRRYREGLPPFKGLETAQQPESQRVLTKIFANSGDVFQPLPCQMQILADGEENFRQIFASIRNAKQYIFAQYYIIRADRLGQELRDLLIEKAKEGVAVYLLMDDLGSFFLMDKHLKSLKQAGVQVARFLPIRFRTRLQINFRNHRKLLLVDGYEAFTGGLNVGMEYIGKRKHVDYWRDTQVRIVGPLVQALQQVFLDDWYFAAKRSIKLDPLQVRSTPAYENVENLHSCYAQVIPFGPTDTDQLGLLLYMQVLQMAKRSLWIATPYFIPDTPLEYQLELAARRGVDVRILIPYKADHLFVHWVTMTYARRMQSKGIRVYLYRKGFMHQKVVQVDGEFAVLGTSNFDNRSMYLNFETAILVHDHTMTMEVIAMLENDFADSEELTPETHPVFFWHQFPAKFARLLAPLL